MLKGHAFIGDFSQGSSNYIGARKKLRISAFLSASFLLIFAGMAIFPVASSVSETNAAARLSETTLSMTSSDTRITFNNALTDKGTFSSGTTGLSVTTNNYSGYTLSISAANDNEEYSQLVNDEDDNTLDSIESAVLEADFSAENATSYNGLWGYKPSKFESQSNNYYRPAPTYAGTTIDATNAANVVANDYTITLGARVSRSNTQGTYSNTFLVNAVANPVGYIINYNANTLDTVTDMPSQQSGSVTEESVTLSSNLPLRAGYNFVNWCDGTVTVNDGVESCSGDEYGIGAEYGIDQTNLNEVTLYAVWQAAAFTCNPSATTISAAVCMQDINKDVKQSMVEETQYQLIDSRDGKEYWVAKLKDGKVWMTQNLDLDLEHTPTNVMPLVHANTDLGWGSDDSVQRWTPDNSTIGPENIDQNGNITGWNSSYSNRTSPYSLDVGDWYWIGNWMDSGTSTYYSSSTNNYLSGDVGNPVKFAQTAFTGNAEHGHMGNYYNWAAAIATNDSSPYSANSYNNPELAPQNSICPAGWRLPDAATYSNGVVGANDYYNLRLAYNDASNDQTYTADPMYMVRAGYIYSGSLSSAGYYEKYWSRTAYNDSSAYSLETYSSGFYPASSNSTYYGYSVRCVARDNGTITYDANGGTGTMPVQQIYGDAVIKENEFTKENKCFAEWNTSSDGNGDVYDEGDKYLIKNGADIILYAQWANRTNVSFDGNGADSGSMNSITVDYKKTESLPASGFVKAGMAFVGWNTEPDGSGSGYGDQAGFYAGDPQGENVTLYAMWEPIGTYTINYHINTGNNPVQYSCHKSGVLSPKYSHTPNLDDAGVQNGNYSDNADLREVITMDGASRLHIKLTYAGESDSYDWVSLWEGSHPEYSAYNNYSTGVRLGNNTTGKYGGGSGTTVEGDINGDTVTVAFRSDGGGQGNGYGYYMEISVPVGPVCDSTPVSGTYIEPSIQNQVFLGWSDTANSNTVDYASETAVQFAIDLTDQVNAKDVYYVMGMPLNITFDANGGTGTMDPIMIEYGQTANIGTNTFTKAGESFVRWNTAADGSGTTYYNDSNISATDIGGGNITLYAQWAVPTTITFDANGGTGSISDLVVDYGNYGTIPGNGNITKTEATFLRWNTAADGSGSNYYQGSSYYASNLSGGTVTMYAIWRDYKVIEYDGNGADSGSVAHDAADYGQNITLKQNGFVKSGYTFVSWVTATDGTGTYYDPGDTYTVNDMNGGTVTMYAMWKPDYVPDMNYDDEGNPHTSGGGGSSGITIARAYELAYIAMGKGMYVPVKDGQGGYNTHQFKVAESSEDYSGIPANEYRFAMQDMTTQICAMADVMPSHVLTVDLRDQKSYWVTKQVDGKCWMTQNLDFDLNGLVTSELSDINTSGSGAYVNGYSTEVVDGRTIIKWLPSSYTQTAASSSIASWSKTSVDSVDLGDYYQTGSYFSPDACDYLAGCTTHFDTTPDNNNFGIHGHVGNLYNHHAIYASNNYALNTSSTNPDVVNSICPKGWRPAYSSDMESWKNITHSVDTNDDTAYVNSPMYIVRSGYIDYASSGVWPIKKMGQLGSLGYGDIAQYMTVYATDYFGFYNNNYNGRVQVMRDGSSGDDSSGVSMRCIAR